MKNSSFQLLKPTSGLRKQLQEMVQQLQQTFSDDVNCYTLQVRDTERQSWENKFQNSQSFVRPPSQTHWLPEVFSNATFVLLLGQFPMQVHQSGPVIHVSLIFMLIISLQLNIFLIMQPTLSVLLAMSHIYLSKQD